MAADPQRSQLIPTPSWLRLLQLIGALWTSPNTLIGLVGGALGLLAGARVRWSGRDCALVFQQWPWGPGGAITLGNVILHTGPVLDVPCRTYAHQAGWGVEPLIRLDDPDDKVIHTQGHPMSPDDEVRVLDDQGRVRATQSIKL